MSLIEDSDIETFPPDWAQAILEWATPRFEAAFVLLHPFVKVPDECLKYIEPDGNSWLEKGGFELLMSHGPEHITWETVQKAVRRENLAQLLADVER